MSKVVLSLTTCIAFFATCLYAAEAPDPFRQRVRNDPVVGAVIDGMIAKYGCPRLTDPVGKGGMTVFKEAEPYSYSSATDSYTEEVPRLLVKLTCYHAIHATVSGVHLLSNERDDLRLTSVTFDYNGFAGIIRHYEPRSVALRKAIIDDPLLKVLYAAFRKLNDQCEEIDEGSLYTFDHMDRDLLYTDGKREEVMKYRLFSYTLNCPYPDPHSGRSYSFRGHFYPSHGYVKWTVISMGGWTT